MYQWPYYLSESRKTTLYPHGCETNENVAGFAIDLGAPRSNTKSFFFLRSADVECQSFAVLERWFSCEAGVKLRI